jgi:hypothetical protein
MERAFFALFLLFRHPSRATMLRGNRIDQPERRGDSAIQSNNILF